MPRFFAQEDLEDCPVVDVHTDMPTSPIQYACGCVTARYVADDVFEMRLAVKCGIAWCQLWPYYYCTRACYDADGCCFDDCPLDPEHVTWEKQHPRCIGCKRFIKRSSNWNQCADCDTREPEEY